MRQANQYFKLLYVIIAVFGISCSKEFDEHFNPKKIDKNIVQILSEDPNHSEFVKMIDKLDLRKTLGEAAIYTCLAPTNDQVNAYLNDLGYYSIDEVPVLELRQYVNNHFLSGRYYKYDIEKRYESAVNGLNPTKSTFYATRGEAKLPAKSLLIFTEPFFAARQEDFQTIYNIDGSGFMVGSASISKTKYDIDANNGVIHVLETPLKILPRTDLAIAADPAVSAFNNWLNTHVTFTLGPKDQFGWVDTTLFKSYKEIRNLASESVLSTVFVPTNEALMNYFQPYLPDLDGKLDSVPKIIISEILRTSVLADPWFKSDIIRNKNPELKVPGGASLQTLHKIEPTIIGAILASNSIVYKVNKFIEPPKLHSVEGGVHMKKKYYGQWSWMFEFTNLEAGLTDPEYYQHNSRTILIQPDIVWALPAQNLDAVEREKKLNECKAGIINMDVRQDGGLRKRYYPTDMGYILFDNNKFTDFTGKQVSLLASNPTWERTNGAIYEINGFLTPTDKLDVTQTIYAKIKSNPQLSNFVAALDKSGIGGELNLGGFLNYTVFAPSNTAMAAAGINVATSTPQQLLAFVNAHIITGRYVFTDGVLQGIIPDKTGRILTAAGAWETFSINTPSGKSVKPVASFANIQGNNGVVHQIDQVL